jgi:hypothetical protein
MKTVDILKEALRDLSQMSNEEVQELSQEKGITIPDEPKKKSTEFTIDLDGRFPEVVNS